MSTMMYADDDCQIIAAVILTTTPAGVFTAWRRRPRAVLVWHFRASCSRRQSVW